MKSLLLFVTFLLSMSFAQNTDGASRVNGYPMLNANKVYSPGQQVRVEEPHGAYSGLITMDAYYFFRPNSVIETRRTQNGVAGTVSASVRSAISPSWEQTNFSYGCDDRDLVAGRIELARMPDSHHLLIGDHNAVCDLKPRP